MGLTSWYSFSTNEVLTSSKMNEQLRDNGRWLSHNATGGAPMGRAYNSANLTISSSTETQLTFDSERFDLQSMHSTVSNTGRLTIPSGGAGVYLVGASIRVSGVAAGTEIFVALRHNSTTTFARQSHPPVTGDEEHLAVVSLYRGVAADWFDVTVWHNHGSDATVQYQPQFSPEFWAIWMGE